MGFSPTAPGSPAVRPRTAYRRAMFGSGRLDGAEARARLRSITPRWVPTEADIDGAASGRDASPSASAVGPLPGLGRHALPERQRSTWRLDAAAARGLISLALAALLGALIVVIAGWPRGDAAPRVEAAREGNGTPVRNVLAQPSPSSSTSGVVVVDVDGAVRHPGVVELPGGSRVVDAIDAAGGVKPKGDTGALNLAQVLLDGEQVVVPNVAAAAGPVEQGAVASPTPGVAPTTGMVNLNTATEVELETLPGIGPVLAAAIVEWRTQNGGFTSIEQLQDVSGIGPSTFADLAPLVRL